MKTYIITRFSIFDYNDKIFKINYRAQSKEIYYNKLFKEERLTFKFKVFKNITLPSIINQTNKNYEWYIYSSYFMPEEYQKLLLEITKPFPQIKCVFTENFKEFYSLKDGPNLKCNKDHSMEQFCTVRLDDDDALCKNFVEILNTKYSSNRFLNNIISFPYGIRYGLKQNKEMELISKMDRKNIGLGLTGIGFNIYNCGNHMKINKLNYKIIYDKTPDIYLCCASQWCDSKRKKIK